MRPILRNILLLAAVLVLIPTAFAQVKTGGITGTVTDVTGGVMPGVEVTIRNQETNVVRTAITNDQGRYTATNLTPGAYEVRFELTGFKRLVSADND
ncbi:MAG TPA: carboxypeptidase-like regulatory domain-containing protein, partial [Acidobacteriota bacterium]|nr:carboxypeptidase-like regulatory domain-containing protein [Acidobacteriota bacterium]